jgi:phosphotriesterase-related protein
MYGMSGWSRRDVLLALGALAAPRSARAAPSPDAGRVMTVTGEIAASEMGTTLVHEHVLVDFIGADRVSRDRYDPEDVFRKVLPHLVAVREAGGRTLVECTPAFLGRDPALLRRLSEASGLRLLTNTGYYGAAADKHVPAHAYTETAEQLAERWTREHRDGIEGSSVRPGFQKIGVDAGPLSAIDRKLVTAAAICHRQTGLTIAVHTGDGRAAMEILDVLKAQSVGPSAYVWVHAQNEKDRLLHLRAAAAGAWIELDGLSPESFETHLAALTDLAKAGHLGRALVSHDAGWYHVGEPGGGRYRGHTLLFERFLPELRKRGLDEAAIRRLTIENPAEAFAIRVRRVP